MLLDNCAQMRPPVQPTITPARRQSVVVVGGGFAGLNLIQHLRDAPVNIVLVDRCNHHLFQPLLYQVATAALAPAEITEPTRSILRNTRNVMMTLIVPSAEPLTLRLHKLRHAEDRRRMAQQPHRRTNAMGLAPRRSAESRMTITQGLWIETPATSSTRPGHVETHRH